MYTRITLTLEKDMLTAIQRLAEKEYRGTKAQIELLIHEALAARGVLPGVQEQPAQPQAVQP